MSDNAVPEVSNWVPPRQRAVVLLRDAMGWSADETAKALGMSVGSAYSALQRARITLAKEFPNGLPNKTPAPSSNATQFLPCRLSNNGIVDRRIFAWFW